VYPYIKAVENLSRCSYEGRKNDFDELVLMSGGTVVKQMPDTSDKVDGNLCPLLVSLGSETNVNTEGDADFLKKLYNRTKGLIGSIKLSQESVTTPEKKPESAIPNKEEAKKKEAPA